MLQRSESNSVDMWVDDVLGAIYCIRCVTRHSIKYSTKKTVKHRRHILDLCRFAFSIRHRETIYGAFWPYAWSRVVFIDLVTDKRKIYIYLERKTNPNPCSVLCAHKEINSESEFSALVRNLRFTWKSIKTIRQMEYHDWTHTIFFFWLAIFSESLNGFRWIKSTRRHNQELILQINCIFHSKMRHCVLVKRKNAMQYTLHTYTEVYL